MHNAGKNTTSYRTTLSRLLLCVFLIAALFLTAVLSLPRTAFAYTESQKRAAKAWLSSHGYPPTEDGAWQAYSDWLDGKWWDEFGSPDEYFGYDGIEEGENDDEEPVTAATQKSETTKGEKKEAETTRSGKSRQGESRKSSAETLVDLMKESGTQETAAAGDSASASESQTVPSSGEALTESVTETGRASGSGTDGSAAVPSAEESATAATQADIMDMVDAVSEQDTDHVMRHLPLAVIGLGAVAVLLAAVIIAEHRKK